MQALDHVLWGTSDLDEAVETFARLSGVRLGGGGPHPGFGTRNQLASLGEGVYFEAIAPDPRQSDHTQRAHNLAALAQPRLSTFAVRGGDLAGYRARARSLGIRASDNVAMSRTRPDGVRLSWQVVYLEDDRWGDLLPFMIDWQASEHPSATTPRGCRLADFAAIHPDAGALGGIYAALGVPVPVHGGPQAGFFARIETPKGHLVLT